MFGLELPDSRKRESNEREGEGVKEKERRVPHPLSVSENVRYSSGPRQKRRDDLNGGGLPLFRQGGATVGLMTRLSARGIREASYLKGGLWKR